MNKGENMNPFTPMPIIYKRKQYKKARYRNRIRRAINRGIRKAVDRMRRELAEEPEICHIYDSYDLPCPPPPKGVEE